MQIKVFSVPLLDSLEINEELNKFLRSIKVLDIKKEFVNNSDGCFWTFCISYFPIDSSLGNYSAIPRKEKVDYRTVLSEEEFVRFNLMRKVRKIVAENDSVPPYAVFTDAELAEIAKDETIELSVLMEIKGIGKKKVDRYGERFCAEYLRLLNDEKNRESEK